MNALTLPYGCIARLHLMARPHQPTSCCLDVNRKQHSQAAEAHKSKHPDDDLHQEANQRQQEKQAVFYDRKACSDKRPLNNREPVFVWNALRRIWQPATVLNRPQPSECPRTYTVNIQGKIYQRTREHLRPRSQSEITPPANSTSPPVGAVASEHDPKDTHITTRLPPLAEDRPKDSTPTPEQSTPPIFLLMKIGYVFSSKLKAAID